MSNIVFARARVRRVLQTTLAVALVGGVVATGGTPAVAAPEKVLQSVAITLGSDSAISGITSTTVRAGEDEELSSDSASLDPGTVAADLPVRVLTSYRLGDRAGTDLSDIEGESGRVVIDVTVQNVTARPEPVVYNFDGAQRQQNALVATPLTVVASADLGEDALGSVVTADDVRPGDVTNGVLGRGAGKSADVQWAALLAPPRLGSSATFRLVQDTDDFEVPTFDLSVQPGLVTDPSVQALLEAAFSEDPSSTLKLETSTIELVSNVNTTLTAASAVLARIQRELGSTAATLGQKTIADLESSASLVSSSLSGLAGDIDSLSSQMSSEMERASADTVAQFGETVGRMQTLLGDPADFEQLPEVESIECGAAIPKLRTKRSITEQMMAISSQLRTIQTATDDCKAAITEGLNAAIGTPDDTAGADTVIGSIKQTQADLLAEAGLLRQAGTDLADDFDGDLLGYLSSSVGTLGGLVETIQDLADELNGGSGGGGSVTFRLRQMQNTLATMQGQLGDGEDGLPALIEGIDASATDALATNGGAAGQVEDVRASVCTIQSALAADDPTRPQYDEVSAMLTGVDCADQPVEGAEPLAAKVSATQASLAEIGDLADTGRSAVGSVVDQVNGLKSTVDGLLNDNGQGQRNKIDELLLVIAKLSDGDEPYFGPGFDEWPTLGFVADPAVNENAIRQCAAVTSFEFPEYTEENPKPANYLAPDPLELMRLFHKQMECNQIGIEDRIDDAFEAGADILEETEGALDTNVGAIDRAKDKANAKVDELVDTLSLALQESDQALRKQGRASVAAQRDRLAAEEEKLSTSLDQRITAAVRRIEGTVADSNRNLVAAEKALKSDLNEVLLDLGTRDEEGSGLLGALSKGAADTGTATEGVVKANATTSEFAGVRSTALADVYLQQAQLSRSLELLEAYPAFGMDLPAGSSHLTVFTFSLGEN
ncbi:hypothetical protein GCM10009623_27530 [Nocardioides aestuarii]|uniref:Uncharacterized protein n=1 Tax=Nocardioides aestuarii TaxID=252231 RepID=A0ABW4TQT0_9ACTN